MTTQEWKRHKFETEGLCLNCVKRPAGRRGGTKTACAKCAEYKRKTEWRRRCRRDRGLYFRIRRRRFRKQKGCILCGREAQTGYSRCSSCRAVTAEYLESKRKLKAAKPKPDHYAMTEEQWLQAKRPPSSVTWNELSAGACNS